METDAVCEPQVCEPEVILILDDFCGGDFWCILLCLVLHTWNYWDWSVCTPVVCLELCICYDVSC